MGVHYERAFRDWKCAIQSPIGSMGLTQSYEVNYFGTYAPVARLSAIRLRLALAVNNDAFIHQMDVRNAFLNSRLNETVYTKQPKGSIDEQFPHYVCKLKRSLYGLKQAAREWYTTITVFLETIGFKNSISDQALFYAVIDGMKVW